MEKSYILLVRVESSLKKWLLTFIKCLLINWKKIKKINHRILKLYFWAEMCQNENIRLKSRTFGMLFHMILENSK